LAERAAIEPDERGMTEIGVDAVEAGGVRDGHIDVIRPGHRLRHDHLLILGGVHIPLTPHDKFGTLHCAISPYLRIISVVADDQADLQTLRSIGYVGAVAGIPAFDRHPWHDLAIFLNDLA